MEFFKKIKEKVKIIEGLKKNEENSNIKFLDTEKLSLFDNCLRKLGVVYIIFHGAIAKFQKDNCIIRSNAIAYSIIISIIPLLTIFVQLAKINRNVVQATIASFLASYGLSESTDLLAILDQILARSEIIAGVGFIFVLYSATNFFRHFEDAFNYIYCVKSVRPFLYRFSLYISGFVVLPLIILFASQMIQSIYYYFEPPEIRKIFLRKGQEWTTASNGILKVYRKRKLEKEIKIKEKVPNQAPYRDYYIDVKNNRTGYPWEVMQTPVYSYELGYRSRYDLVWAGQTPSMIYAISLGSTIYYSKDEGETWEYQQLAFISNSDVYAPRVSDVYGDYNSGRLFLLVSEAPFSRLVIRDSEKKWSYKKLPAYFKRIVSIQNIQANAQSSYKNGLYLLGKSKYLYSPDNGLNWQGPFEEKYGDRKLEIQSMQADRYGNMYFVSKKGDFWIQSKKGVIYPDIRSSFDQKVNGMFFFSDGKGFIYGTSSLFRYTSDYGRTWHFSDNKLIPNLEFLSHQLVENKQKKEIYFTGKEDVFLFSPSFQNLSKRDMNGYSLMKLKYDLISYMSTWKSALLTLFIEPLLFVVFFFILLSLYIIVPYTKVSFSSAMIGSIVSSIGLMGFLLSFRLWISGFTITGYIYGGWAAVPLLMICILFSIYIVLFGLEVSYITQSRQTNKG